MYWSSIDFSSECDEPPSQLIQSRHSTKQPPPRRERLLFIRKGAWAFLLVPQPAILAATATVIQSAPSSVPYLRTNFRISAMVNIPGRSRGCVTCRKRRKGVSSSYISSVRRQRRRSPSLPARFLCSAWPGIDTDNPLSQCDLRHPTCGQCSKAKLACGGYDPQRIFINTTSTRNLRQTDPTEVALRPSLARSAYGDKFFSLFWDIYLGVPSKDSSECLSRYPIGSWRSIAWDFRHQDNVGSRAVLAMVLSTIGRKNEESWMMQERLKLYVGALSEAQTNLRHPTKWKADSLLLACSALGMFEVLRCPSYRTQANADDSSDSSYCSEQKPRAKPCYPRHAAGMATPLERWLWSSRDRRQHTSKALHIDCSSTREYTWYVLSHAFSSIRV